MKSTTFYQKRNRDDAKSEIYGHSHRIFICSQEYVEADKESRRARVFITYKEIWSSSNRPLLNAIYNNYVSFLENKFVCAFSPFAMILRVIKIQKGDSKGIGISPDWPSQPQPSSKFFSIVSKIVNLNNVLHIIILCDSSTTKMWRRTPLMIAVFSGKRC